MTRIDKLELLILSMERRIIVLEEEKILTNASERLKGLEDFQRRTRDGYEGFYPKKKMEKELKAIRIKLNKKYVQK